MSVEEPDEFRFLDPDSSWSREPEGSECVICGDEPDPYSFDKIPVETPDGRVYLNLNDPSCMDCRKDVVRKLSARGLQQQGLGAFADPAENTTESDGDA